MPEEDSPDTLKNLVLDLFQAERDYYASWGPPGTPYEMAHRRRAAADKVRDVRSLLAVRVGLRDDEAEPPKTG